MPEPDDPDIFHDWNFPYSGVLDAPMQFHAACFAGRTFSVPASAAASSAECHLVNMAACQDEEDGDGSND